MPDRRAPFPRAEREERHLFDYLRVVYRRRWIAIPAFLFVFVPSAVNTFRTVPVYEARAQLQIERDTPAVASLDQLFQQREGWFEDDYYQTQYRLLQSRTLARKTVGRMRLWEHPVFAGGATRPQSTFTIGGALAAARNGISQLAGGARRAPNAGRRPDETDGESRVLDSFLGALSVAPLRNTRLVEIRFMSTDPELAKRMANEHANAYIEWTLEQKYTTSKDASDWLSQQLGQQRRAVEESEAKLQRYKEQHDAVAVDDRQNVVVQKFTTLNDALTRAKTERIDKEAAYNQLKAAQNTAAIDTFPAVVGNEYIQRLKGELGDLQKQQAQLADRYGDEHPEMKKVRSSLQAVEAKLKVEVGKIVESVRNEFETAKAREVSLQQAVTAQKAETLSLNRKSMEYSVLEREAESNRRLYESLLARTKETGMSGERRTSNTRVVDQAELPTVPVLPAKQRDLMLGAFAGLLLALGLVIGFEYLDNRVKTPQQLKAELSLPFLGMVPVIPKREGLAMMSQAAAGGEFVEAIKHIRTNILFSSTHQGARCLLVTSAGPGEGKSLMSASLAVALAQMGQRVLLVDGDMRRPRVHENFGVPQEPGLSNLLVGDSKPSEVVRATKVPNLLVLPAGHIPPNPIELLASQPFKECLMTLGRELGWVVIDSPPLLVVSDATVISTIATGVVLVVAADQTSRHAARQAAEQLRSVNAKVIGTVLNRVALHRHPYYYSQYSRKNYGRYYTSGQPHQPPRRQADNGKSAEVPIVAVGAAAAPAPAAPPGDPAAPESGNGRTGRPLGLGL